MRSYCDMLLRVVRIFGAKPFIETFKVSVALITVVITARYECWPLKAREERSGRRMCARELMTQDLSSIIARNDRLYSRSFRTRNSFTMLHLHESFLAPNLRRKGSLREGTCCFVHQYLFISSGTARTHSALSVSRLFN